MGLADDIAGQRELEILRNYIQEDFKYDEFGLRVPNAGSGPPIDYLVARLFRRNRYLYYDPEVDALFVGSRLVNENAQTLANMCGGFMRGMGTWYGAVWARVRDVAPILDRDKIWIGPRLLYNMKKGEMESQEATNNHI